MATVIRMQLWIQDHRPVLLALVMVALIMGLAAECPGEEGLSQEGDNGPNWRRS